MLMICFCEICETCSAFKSAKNTDKKQRETKKARRVAFTIVASVANNCELPLSVIGAQVLLEQDGWFTR